MIPDVIVGLLIFFIVWFILVIIAGILHAKNHSKALRILNPLITLWVIGAVIFLVYSIIVNIREISWFLASFVVLAVFAVLIFTSVIAAKYMVAPYKPSSGSEPSKYSEAINSQLRYLSKHRNKVLLLNFIIPLLTYYAAYNFQFTIVADSIREVLSDIFLVFSGLLILVVTFYIFIFERKLHQTQREAEIHQKIADLLIRRVTMLGALYVFTILTSVLSLMSTTNDPLVFIPSDIVKSSLFALVVYFTFYSLILTIIIFNQIVGVYKDELPVSKT